MKKFLLIGFLAAVFLFVGTPRTFAYTWTDHSGSSGSRIWAHVASSSDGAHLVAVENYTSSGGGYIYTSSDGGATWTNHGGSSGAQYWLRVASSSNGSHLVAVERDTSSGEGYIYTSSDGGATWTTHGGSSGSRSWFGVASDSSGLKLAASAGSSDYIYTSSDGGATWTTHGGSSGSHNWTDIASSTDGAHLVAACSDAGRGYIYTSSDGGATWTNHGGSSGIGYWLRVASSADGSHLVAVTGDTLQLYTSIDSGVTWVRRVVDGFEVASDSSGMKLITSSASTHQTYTSTNGGVTWILEPLTSNGPVASDSSGTQLVALSTLGYINETTTASVTLSVVDTVSSSGITLTTAELHGNLVSSGGSSGTEGIEYGLTTSYGTNVGVASFLAGVTGAYSTGTRITSLSCGTTYHYRAWATTAAGTAHGSDMTFATLPCLGAPIVLTVSATSITPSTVTLTGNLTDLGGAPSATAGFNYGLTTTYGSSVTMAAPYTVPTLFVNTTVSGLTCATTYHFRAYATNTAGTANGADMTFTTLPCAIRIPIVSTLSATTVGTTTGYLNAHLADDGGALTVYLGFNYGLTTAYGTSIPVASLGMGRSPYDFVSGQSGLLCNTLYHYEATATNTAGTGLGGDMTFRTLPCPTVSPTVLTVSATSITTSTVTLTGNLTDLGGAPSATAGFNYGLTTAYGSTVTMSSPYTVPTLYVNTTITGLTCGTLYHYRAWATNSVGTTNGSDMTFTTGICLTPPAVTTDSVTPGSTSATFNGTIVSLGGASSASVRGFSYNTTPTLATIGLDPAIDSGVGTFSTGPYSLTITGLACATTYHYRAYAENTTGMGHGADMSFTTLACSLVAPTVHTMTATVSGATATLTGHLDSFGIGASGPLTSASVAFNFGGTTVASSTPTLSSLTNFSGTVTVACGSTYSYFATAMNAGGGATTDLTPVSFTTPACPATAPIVVTDPATAITTTTATISGHVTAFGTSATSITSRTLSSSSGGAGSTMTVITTLPSPFSQSLVGLTCNTTYTFTASAMNNAGLTGTGATLSFTTSACPIGGPTVTTTAATAITTTTATINGNVTSLGSGATSMTSRGFTGSFGTPITATGSFGTGTFSSALTGLTCNTNYTFTATGTNNAGLSATGATLSFTTSACPIGAPTITTTSASAITTTSATLNGSVTALGLGATSISSRGFTTSFGSPISVSGTFSTGAFTANVTGLTCNSAYSFVAKATNNVAVSASGASVSFRTLACPAGSPAVTTDTATTVSDVSATLNATVTSLGSGATSLTPSFEYGTSTALGTAVPVGSSGWITAPRAYNMALSGLTCGTTYYYQAQVVNDGGASALGLIKNFTTDACTGAPSVATISATSVTTTSALLHGNLLSNGGDTSTVTYFAYDTSTAYSLSTSGVVTPVGAFTDTVSGLTCGTTYHFSAGAFNGSGSDNGVDMTFTTLACTVGTPAVTTNAATGITTTGATLNGTVTSLGAGATSATRGFAGSFGAAVIVSGSITSAPSAYSYTLSGLTCNTTYTYNATVTNDASHSAAGGTLSFTTSACPIGAPIVTTTSASAVTATSATLGGNLTSTGGASSTTVSFEYGLTTSYGTTASAGTRSTTGAFTATSGVLACNTMYHYRAKALNTGGSANGGDVTFTTSACPISTPTVTTTSASAVTATSATLGGNLTSTGGASSTTVSFEYGTTTAYGTTVSGGTMSTTGTFSGTTSSLACHTTYHYRAKATNTAGSSNGTDATFTTGVCDPTVATVSGSLLSGILTGNLTSLGAGATSASVGFYYGDTTAYSSGSVNATTPGPTMSSTGTFTANVPVGKVSCNTPWHVKAWARNASGVTVTGADVSFCN